MEKNQKRKKSTRLSKRFSKMSIIDTTKNISNKQLFETFKDNQVDFIIINSLLKLPNKDKEEKNELINRIYENIKKKDLFFFFLNFYKINDEILKKIIPYLTYEYHQKSSHLFEENDFSIKLYFIIKGFVTFHKNEIIFDSQKQSSIVDIEKFILGPDKYFGEIDLIYDKKKTMSAFCKTECHLITLNKEIFKKYLEDKITKIELEKKKYIFSFFKNFSNIPNIRLEKFVLNNVQTLFYRKNKIIYKEGEKNNGLYLIYKGEAIIINDINKGEFSYLKNYNEKIKYIQKKAVGLDYVGIVKNTNIKNDEKILYEKEKNKNNKKINDINNDIELNDLNLLLDKNKFDIICRMNRGAIGGLEIVTGINILKYNLISNSDFTCILKIELKNIDNYLSNFLINLIPVFLKFEKNIHERIKNMKIIDENITPSSVKKLNKNKKNKFKKKEPEEENDKIYKKNIQNIDNSFQLNCGGFIKNNEFNFNLYQKKEHFKELLKKNFKKIIHYDKYLKYLDLEEKSNLKYSEFKMQKYKNLINQNNKSKKISNKTSRVASCKLIKNKKNILRLGDKKENDDISDNFEIFNEKAKTVEVNSQIRKNKKPKLTWKFYDNNTRTLKKSESKKNIDKFYLKSNKEEKIKTKYLNLLNERKSLSIDYDYMQKVFLYANPKMKIKNRYKIRQLLFLTPKKNKYLYNYNSDQKEEKTIFKNKNIKNLKKIFLYDSGNFDMPLLSEEM